MNNQVPTKIDLIHVNPLDFNKAYALFTEAVEVWSHGFTKWGDHQYFCSFVQNPTITRGTAIGVNEATGLEVMMNIGD